MFDLKDFLIAAENVRHITPPVQEVRMHPDDIRELRNLADPLLCHPSAAVGGERIYGIDIIEDASAPRLPRRPTTAQPGLLP